MAVNYTFGPLYALVILLSFTAFVDSEAHSALEGQVVTFEPVDSTLWAHIIFMCLSFGVLCPIGMVKVLWWTKSVIQVLGLAKSRWHIPVQVGAIALASASQIYALNANVLAAGWFLGHSHEGHQFAPNIHASFAPFIACLMIGQLMLGTYLKFNAEGNSYIRRAAVLCHGTVGKITPIIIWVQMGFGGITLLGFCRADYFYQVISYSKVRLMLVHWSRSYW